MSSRPNANTTSEETCPRGGTIHNCSYQHININRWSVHQSQGIILKPLLKKIDLEPVFTNYHPVSNLSYLPKLIERTVCNQITTYTESTDNLEKLQSAYHTICSTETALLKVKTDLLSAIDNKEITCLILLDLSTAFDTVNNTILLSRLKYHQVLSKTRCNAWLALYNKYLNKWPDLQTFPIYLLWNSLVCQVNAIF